MPGITNPAEEYFKDGLWGWVSTAWKKLIADASGFLKINFAAQGIDVEVKQTAPADLTPGVCGWIGSAWQKLPMLWGYSDVWRNAAQAVDVTAGDDTVGFTAIGAGEVVVVTNFCLRYSQANASRVELRVVVDGMTIILKSRATLVAWDSIDIQCNVVLNVSDYLAFYYKGASAGDDFYAYACGYKMEVAE